MQRSKGPGIALSPTWERLFHERFGEERFGERLRVADFDFDLPEELIAQQPPAGTRPKPHAVDGPRRRRASRCAIQRVPFPVAGGRSAGVERQPGDSGAALRAADLACGNGRNPPGALKSCSLSRQVRANGVPWSEPGRKVAIGERLVFDSPSGQMALEAEVVERGGFGERLLRFAPVADFYAALEQIGHMPLPPYIRRDDAMEDRERYQTVFARERGSVAAPTAGLHFTSTVLDALAAKGVEIARVTLHVGLGTFAPLRVERVDEVRLHRERYTIPEGTAESVNRAKEDGRRIIAVGTTVVRTLEAVALRGGRWTAGAAHRGDARFSFQPGFQFRIVNGLLTNFHLPQSSLLILVSAFAGRERVLAAYAHAVTNSYRFFSYGDCMFLT